MTYCLFISKNFHQSQRLVPHYFFFSFSFLPSFCLTMGSLKNKGGKSQDSSAAC